MKFSVKREKLQKALQKVGSITGSHSVSMLPILANVVLKAEEGRLTLTTTDLEVRMSASIEAEVEEAGVTTVPVRKLSGLVGAFFGEEVKISSNENDHLKIECGSGRFTLLGLPAADFPAESEFEKKQELKLSEKELKRLIGSIIYAVSVDDSRKILSGILFNVHDGILTMVATDSKRMAMQDYALEGYVGEEISAIVPLKAAAELRRLLEGDAEVTVSFSDKQCSFKAENFELSSKLIEGKYPNYRQVVPASFKREVEIPAGQFLRQIETVSMVLSETSSFVILNFENNVLRVQASSTEVGEGCDELAIDYAMDPFEVSFNPVYLADPLKNCNCETIRVKLNDPLNPVAIEAGEGFLYVIMPIRKK